MHVINIHAAYMSSVNSRYSQHELYKIYIFIDLHIEYTKRSHGCDPTLHQTAESNICLGTDKFNKWLREALFNIHTLPRGTRLLSGTTLA